MKKRYLGLAFAAAAYITIGNIVTEIDKHNARTGVDLDLHAEQNIAGIYGMFDYKPNPEERALINEPR